MIPLYEDLNFTFRFADDRIIPRFHLEGMDAGRRVSVFKIDRATGERLGLMMTARVGESSCRAGPNGEPTSPLCLRKSLSLLTSFFLSTPSPPFGPRAVLYGAVANVASGAGKCSASAVVLAIGVFDAAADNDMMRGETKRGLK